MAETIGCVKAANEILGDKWTPQLLRFLLNNPHLRFCQLQKLVGGINPRTLSARLADLESAGIVEKLTTSSNGRCQYRLTEKGKDLAPILHDMEHWGQRYAHS